MLLKISMRTSRQYTLGKEDSIILFVKYGDREIFYPHKKMRASDAILLMRYLNYAQSSVTTK